MKKFLSRLALPILLFFPSVVLSADNPPPKVAGGLGEAIDKFKSAGNVAYGEGTKDFEAIVGTIIQTFLGLLGVIFLALALYGGYLWMMARGNEQQVEKARETLKAATIGLAIILAAYAITDYVITSLINATTTG